VVGWGDVHLRVRAIPQKQGSERDDRPTDRRRPHRLDGLPAHCDIEDLWEAEQPDVLRYRFLYIPPALHASERILKTRRTGRRRPAAAAMRPANLDLTSADNDVNAEGCRLCAIGVGVHLTLGTTEGPPASQAGNTPERAQHSQ
jgi:hypothetical protein